MESTMTPAPDQQDKAIAVIATAIGSDSSFIRSVQGGLELSQSLCHELATRSGWWAGKDPHDPEQGAVKIALMHSELSEALEGIRKDTMDDHLPHRKSVEVELADAVIRIFDYAGARGLDVAGAMIEKLAYNQQRADHKLENRAKSDGKKF
ncbi:hypothetical protein D3C77_04680 [compost metagenome]